MPLSVKAIAKNNDLLASVTPEKAGFQDLLKRLDSGFRRDDGIRRRAIGQNFWQLVYQAIDVR